MGQIFELCQVREFKVERVNHEPAINRHRDENDPKHCHGDVIEENQVVDDGEEQKGKKSEASKDPKTPKPWDNPRLVFLRKKSFKVLSVNFKARFETTKAANKKIKRNEIQTIE